MSALTIVGANFYLYEIAWLVAGSIECELGMHCLHLKAEVASNLPII